MIREAITMVVEGINLSFTEAAAVMEDMMTGQATHSQVASFLTALRMKGETVEEIAGLASVMREKSIHVNLDVPALDIVGTGGDCSGTLNISTAAAFVVAGAGFPVAKHGNRAATSKCGSADVLEALGVRLELSAENVKRCVEETGIGFMFAPSFHPAMKFVAPARKEIGIRTVFNILGPLTNPARVQHILLGVPATAIGEKMAAVLRLLGTKHALVVYGSDGIDEMSISAESLVWEVCGDTVKSVHRAKPQDFRCPTYPKTSITGGSPADNARAILDVLSGNPGAFRDAVIMNAAAALLAGDIATGNLEAAEMASESIDSGHAKQKLRSLVSLSSAF